MREMLKFYINGEWVDPVEPRTLDVINPATEAVLGRISLGSAADVDRAVAAAAAAGESFAATRREERIALLVGQRGQRARQSLSRQAAFGRHLE